MNNDFYQLFVPGTAWPMAASRISVFSLNTTYAETGPEEKLKVIATWLSAHRISLNVSLQALYTQGCGQGIEGMVQTEHQPGDIARRLKALGITVASFSFDGPLGFGHSYTGDHACQYSVREVARRLAHTVADIRTTYPQAMFFDYEGTMRRPLNEWLGTLTEWLADYKAETGTELDGLTMDLDFREQWTEIARATVSIVHSRGVKSGIFIDAAGGPSVTDKSWMAAAKKSVEEIKQSGISLDSVVVASWMLHPKNLVPESDAAALTSLVNFASDIEQ